MFQRPSVVVWLLAPLVAVACGGPVFEQAEPGAVGDGGSSPPLDSGAIKDASPPFAGDASSCAPCAPPHATPACSGEGRCIIGVCNTNYADCNHDPDDGCEVEVTTPANCGACGATCTPAAPFCVPNSVGYACGTSCGSAQALCNGSCTSLANDDSNCGECGHACPQVANGENDCVNGACSVTCAAGASLCDGTCVLPDLAHGVFVSPSSALTSGCGAPNAPCATVAAGLDAATRLGASVVYLDQGNYAEAISLPTGVTLTGGWVYAGGGSWTKRCTPDASALAVIAPAANPIAVQADGVTAALDTLTLDSSAPPAAGASLYGLLATNGALVSLNAVVITTGVAGPGAMGPPGQTGVGTLPCTSGTGGGGGSAGAGGTAGTVGTYGASGYQPVSGGPGGTGTAGNNGTGQLGTPATCSMCTSDETGCHVGPGAITPTAPGPGCGGNPGSPGGGGGGGGASIGIYAWASAVTVNGGTITVGGGGAGGPGGPGGPGAAGSTGDAGCAMAQCGGGCNAKGVCGGGKYTTACSSPGVGQAGGTGGVGGGGAGGDAFDWVTGAGGTVNASGVRTVYPVSGALGGAAPHVGSTGNVGVHRP